MEGSWRHVADFKCTSEVLETVLCCYAVQIVFYLKPQGMALPCAEMLTSIPVDIISNDFMGFKFVLRI